VKEKSRKTRIDQLLVKRGLVDTRESAQRLILAGKVKIGEQFAQKAGQRVEPDAEIHLLEPLKYAGRGGTKLEKALDSFRIDVKDKVILDVGASTGGFTDCVLQRGARRVFAVDVGYGQLAWKLRQDPRVTVIDRTNARHLERDLFPETIDLAVMDVSFISATKILPALVLIADEAIVLIKPQFEAGPRDVPSGGVIRDPQIHRRVLCELYQRLEGWKVHGLIDSPILGGSGNREFFVHLKQTDGLNEKEYEQRVGEIVNFHPTSPQNG